MMQADRLFPLDNRLSRGKTIPPAPISVNLVHLSANSGRSSQKNVNWFNAESATTP